MNIPQYPQIYQNILKKYSVFLKLKITCRATLYVANLAVYTDRAYSAHAATVCNTQDEVYKMKSINYSFYHWKKVKSII